MRRFKGKYYKQINNLKIFYIKDGNYHQYTIVNAGNEVLHRVHSLDKEDGAINAERYCYETLDYSKQSATHPAGRAKLLPVTYIECNTLLVVLPDVPELKRFKEKLERLKKSWGEEV